MSTDSEFVKIEDVVQTESGRTLIMFRVTPGSSRRGFGGYDPWRKSIKVSLKSQPKKGEANAELILLLSEWFGIEESDIEIVSGKKDRSKSISIQGLEESKVLEVLRKLQEES